jgi:hypothetical protein
MKLALAIVIVAVARAAHADVFAFKDLAGFEACMTLDHLVETVGTDAGAQTRLLGRDEIQTRCIASAVKLLSGSKDSAAIVEYVKTTRRLAAPVAALDLVRVLVDASLPACNDLTAYEALLAGLAMPNDDQHFLPKARDIAKRCLADNAFKKDFVDEAASSDRHIAAHACQILLEANLVKSCARS